LPPSDGLGLLHQLYRSHPELYRIIEEAQFVAQDVYREHYLTFVEGLSPQPIAARSRGEISDGPDELRAWILIGMSGVPRHALRSLGPGPVTGRSAEQTIAFVSEGLARR
jgi:hypothetical protein